MTAERSMRGGAYIVGEYRYQLWRDVLPQATGQVLFVMLNPSTADGETDDATIRRCVAFTRREAFRWLTVVNLFALRAREPKALRTSCMPIGPENDHYIEQSASAADLVIAAWGAWSWPLVDERARHVLELLTRDRDVFALGTTRSGSPRHPLYLSASAPAEIYRPRRIAAAPTGASA